MKRIICLLFALLLTAALAGSAWALEASGSEMDILRGQIGDGEYAMYASLRYSQVDDNRHLHLLGLYPDETLVSAVILYKAQDLSILKTGLRVSTFRLERGYEFGAEGRYQYENGGLTGFAIDRVNHVQVDYTFQSVETEGLSVSLYSHGNQKTTDCFYDYVGTVKDGKLTFSDTFQP